MKWLRENIDLRDIFTFGGILLIGVGLWMIYPAASLAVIGVILFWLGTGLKGLLRRKG